MEIVNGDSSLQRTYSIKVHSQSKYTNDVISKYLVQSKNCLTPFTNWLSDFNTKRRRH